MGKKFVRVQPGVVFINKSGAHEYAPPKPTLWQRIKRALGL